MKDMISVSYRDLMNMEFILSNLQEKDDGRYVPNTLSHQLEKLGLVHAGVTSSYYQYSYRVSCLLIYSKIHAKNY